MMVASVQYNIYLQCVKCISSNLYGVLPVLFYVLCILFQTATYCDMYPVTNYTMEIKQFSPGSDVQTLNFRSAINHLVANDLSENEIYTFRMTAWNSVGSISSDAVEVCKLAIMYFQFPLILGHG